MAVHLNGLHADAKFRGNFLRISSVGNKAGDTAATAGSMLVTMIETVLSLSRQIDLPDGH
jgi:hypothetical protein